MLFTRILKPLRSLDSFFARDLETPLVCGRFSPDTSNFHRCFDDLLPEALKILRCAGDCSPRSLNILKCFHDLFTRSLEHPQFVWCFDFCICVLKIFHQKPWHLPPKRFIKTDSQNVVQTCWTQTTTFFIIKSLSICSKVEDPDGGYSGGSNAPAP